MLFFSVLFLTREEKGWVQTRNVAKVGIALLVSGASIFVIGTFLSPLLVSGIMGETDNEGRNIHFLVRDCR